MELEESRKLKKFIREMRKKNHNVTYNYNDDLLKDLETILQALDNSIPKEKVKENIKVAKQTPRKEFCNYDDYTFGKIRALEELLEE